jgi:hypothetical protein
MVCLRRVLGSFGWTASVAPTSRSSRRSDRVRMHRWSLTYGNQSDVHHKLEIVSPWIGRRTLGVRIAPAGTWKDEFEYRRSQSRELALKIAGSVLPRETARTGYYRMVRPKLEYPLTVTQFTQLECGQITSPVICACLSKMGYNCNSPKEVVYRPRKHFGFGIHNY